MQPTLIVLALVLGCAPPSERGSPFDAFDPIDDGDDTDDTVDPADDDDVVPALSCGEPWVEGPRLADEGADRGLTERVFSATLDMGIEDDDGGSELVAHDLDADGDVDLLLLRLDDGPTLYENDGQGRFTSHGEPLDFSFVEAPEWLMEWAAAARVVSISAVDLNGDGLPELVTSGFGRAEIWPNEGDLQWGDPVVLHTDDTPFIAWTTVVFGDLNGDGLLDVLLPTQQLEQGETPDALHPVLLGRADGSYQHVLDLRVGEAGSDSIASTIDDFDRDGDADIILLMDQGDRSGVFRNDGNDPGGVPIFTDVAEQIGFDRPFNAMGMDTADINDDGILDWCVSDNGPPACLFSIDDGYMEVGAAAGLVPEDMQTGHGSIGWTIEFADLDNDGHVEMIQASGIADGETERFPDLLFHGLPGGVFEDWSEEWGVDSTDDHYAAATADFDDDGFLDLIMTGPGLVPELHMTRCGDESWIDFDLAGPPGNAEAYGAFVEVELPDRTLVRTIYSQRSQGQTPSRVHFGLGNQNQGIVARVFWPDGQKQELGELQPNIRYQLRHWGTVVPTLPGVEPIDLP